jgi:hypothetical protein
MQEFKQDLDWKKIFRDFITNEIFFETSIRKPFYQIISVFDWSNWQTLVNKDGILKTSYDKLKLRVP